MSKISLSAEEIAAALIAMRDQAKLQRIAELINCYLEQPGKKPRRTAFDKLFDELAASMKKKS